LNVVIRVDQDTLHSLQIQRGEWRMKLIWLGHGGFRLETGETTLLIDPWLTGNPMLEDSQHDAATQGATHILLTHAHFDHVADVLELAKHLSVPIVGQYDLM
jgi:L-ascorbate metabolism protein UlaG (beta-lactamase superfamily)